MAKYTDISEKELTDLLKREPNYKEGEKKLIYFDGEHQLASVKNKETEDIVSIVRRKKVKEVWEDV